MNITIEKQAFETILFGILSCRCPVTEQTERDLFRAFRAAPEDDCLALAPFMEIADRNPEKTPLHLFYTFCSLGRNDPKAFHITMDDAVRYFASRFHYDRIAAAIDPLTITHPPGHLVGHMLIAVQLEGGGDAVDVRVGQSVIRFRNLFIPAEVKIRPGEWQAMHLGMILGILSDRQARIAWAHLDTIPEISALAARVREVDYADYQGFGDYRAIVMSRYQRHV